MRFILKIAVFVMIWNAPEKPLFQLTKGESISAIRFVGIPISIVLGVGIGILTGFMLSIFFKKLHIRDSAKVIIILSVAFLLIALENMIKGFIPFSGLLAVMAAGVTILKNTPITAKRISSKFSKLWVGAEILLFVLVGASVNIGYAVSAGFKTILLITCVLLIRAVGILLCLIKTNLNRKERLFCIFTGVPKATVQAVIGGIPLAMGLPCGEVVLTVAVISVLFTAPVRCISVG